MPSSLPSPIYTDVRFYTGEPGLPREIKNLRESTMSAMRRVGTPALLKRVYTSQDVDDGNAQPSAGRDPIYGQTRHADPLSYGTGFTSIDTQPGEWYDPQTFELHITDIDAGPPNPAYLPAPRYRGYGPGFLTYVILPDRPEDIFKLTPQGALHHLQQAKVQLPWWPVVGDDDLLITCSLDDAGRILETYERYQLKQVQPITMRGHDRSGRREFSGANAGGNRYWVGQECEAVKVPPFDVIYSVETDR